MSDLDSITVKQFAHAMSHLITESVMAEPVKTGFDQLSMLESVKARLTKNLERQTKVAAVTANELSATVAAIEALRKTVK